MPPRRANTVINLANAALTADEKFLLVWNQNPGTSVTVIDLDERAVAGEIATPGCSLVYPDQTGGFVMLCGDGKLLAVTLDAAGAEAGRWSSEAFNDIDNDPLSEKAAKVAGVWHFVSYQGQVQPIDVSGNTPRILKKWWLTSAEQRADNWRPAGWHWTAGHDAGRLWVGMTPDGYQGSHKDPAPEVWLFDTDTRRADRTLRVARAGAEHQRIEPRQAGVAGREHRRATRCLRRPDGRLVARRGARRDALHGACDSLASGGVRGRPLCNGWTASSRTVPGTSPG